MKKDLTVATCTRCGKKSYPNRRTARKAARIYHPGDHLTAYPCPDNPRLWHLGHNRPWRVERERLESVIGGAAY